MEPYGLTIASRGTLRQQASLAVSAPLKRNVMKLNRFSKGYTMSNNKFIAIVFSGLVSLGTATITQAQYIGPSAQKSLESVSEILKNPIDGQRVVLRGYLVKQVGVEKYLFSDNTGEIRVEIDAEGFRGLTVDEKTRVELIGEVEKDFLHSPEIDVDVISVSPK